MMKWLFRRLFPASGGPVCFLQSETFIQTKRRHFIVFAWRNSNELLEPLWQPWPGVSPTAILIEEKALGTRLVIVKTKHVKEEKYYAKPTAIESAGHLSAFSKFGQRHDNNCRLA